MENSQDPINDPAKQFAYLLLGFLALQGLIREDEAKDEGGAWIDALTDGMNVAAAYYDFVGYEDMRDLCRHAEWGRLHEPRKDELPE